MAVPKANQFYRAVLEVTSKGATSLSVKEIIEQITARFSLTEDDSADMVPSGTQTRVENRTYWAISKLKNAGLLVHPARGQSQITPQGRDFLANHKGDIENSELHQMRAANPKGSSKVEIIDDDAEDITPDEQMAKSNTQHQEMLSDEILDSLKEMPPTSFERLVVGLLERMGYGDGRPVGRSGDQGIDGTINQDPLGLEKVYVQAKRWDTGPVGEPEIRNFSGSLIAQGANKGVFITTSTFSSTAQQSAKNISMGNQFVRLIDGRELAQLMIQHGVGVVTEITYEVKKLDANYFAEV